MVGLGAGGGGVLSVGFVFIVVLRTELRFLCVVGAHHQPPNCASNSLPVVFFFYTFRFPKGHVNCRLRNGDWESSGLQVWLRGEALTQQVPSPGFQPQY